jgi:hypothetical protein
MRLKVPAAVLSTGRRSDGQVAGTVDQMDQASRSKTGTPCVKRFNAHFLQRYETRPARGHRGDLAFERRAAPPVDVPGEQPHACV